MQCLVWINGVLHEYPQQVNTFRVRQRQGRVPVLQVKSPDTQTAGASDFDRGSGTAGGRYFGQHRRAGAKCAECAQGCK